MFQAVNDARAEELPLIPIEHFSAGLYLRELHLPAGTRIVGHRHSSEHYCIVVGDCTVYTERGQEHLKGFNIFKSPAGEKRAVHCHSALIWTTVHGTDCTTSEEVLTRLILPETPGLGLHLTNLRLTEAQDL